MKGTDDANNQLDEMAGHLFSINGAALAAGAALGFLASQALANSISAAADFESSMVEVEKVTDRATTNLRQLSDSLRDMAPRLGQSQTDLAEVAATAGRMGFEGSENIARFTRTVSEMAVATQLATDDASRAFAKLVRQTDATENEVRNIGAAVNILSNNLAASADEIVEASTRSGAVLTQLGLRAEDIFALNASVAAISDSARRAGSRLRRLGQELLDPRRVQELSKTFGITADRFRRLRDEAPTQLILAFAKKMREGGESAAQLNKILSTQSAQSLAILARNLDNTQEALELSSEEMEEATSLAEEFDKASQTLNFHLDQTESLLSELAIQTGQGTNPTMLGLVKTFNDVLRVIKDFNQRTDGAVVALTLLGGAIGGVSIAVKALITLFAQGSISLAGFTLSANTAALAVGGLLTAISLLAIAWGSNFADIRTITTEGADDIIEDLGRIRDALDKNEEKIKDQKSAWENIVNFFEVRLANSLDEIRIFLENVTTLLAGTFEAAAAAEEGRHKEAGRIARQALREIDRQRRELRQEKRRRREGEPSREDVVGAAPFFAGRTGEKSTKEVTDTLKGLSEQEREWLRMIQEGVNHTSTNTARTAQNTEDFTNLKNILRTIALRTGQQPSEQQIRRAVEDGTIDATELTQLFGAKAHRRDVISALRTIAQKPGLELKNDELRKIISDQRITNNELRKWLPEIALNTGNTSTQLQESEVIQGDTCDLREFLLGPFERVSQGRGDQQDGQDRLPGDPIDLSMPEDGLPTTPQGMVDRTKNAVIEALGGTPGTTDVTDAVNTQTNKSVPEFEKSNELLKKLNTEVGTVVDNTSTEAPTPEVQNDVTVTQTPTPDGEKTAPGIIASASNKLDQLTGQASSNITDGISQFVGQAQREFTTSTQKISDFVRDITQIQKTANSLQKDAAMELRQDVGKVTGFIDSLGQPKIPQPQLRMPRLGVQQGGQTGGLFGGVFSGKPKQQKQQFQATVAKGVKEGVEQALSEQDSSTTIEMDGKKVAETTEKSIDRFITSRTIDALD